MFFKTFQVIFYLFIILTECVIIKSSTEFPPLFESSLKYLKETLEWESNESIDRATVLREYDFIVVGAGSAGSVMASRLSEVIIVENKILYSM